MSVLDSIGKWFSKNAPTLLTIGTGIGIGTTAYFSAKASLKASEKIEELERDGHDITKEEFLKEVLPCYIPAGVSLLLSEGLNAANWKVNKERTTALAGGMALLSGAFAKYRDIVKEENPELDEKAMEQVRAEIREELRQEFLEELDDGKRTFLLDFLDEPVVATRAQLLEGFIFINEQIHRKKFVTADDFCEYMDAPKLKWHDGRIRDESIPGPGSFIGWSQDSLNWCQGDDWVDFYIDDHPCEDESGMIFYCVYCDIKPSFDYDLPICYSTKKL